MQQFAKVSLLALVLASSFTAAHGQQKLNDQVTLSGVLEIDAYSLSEDVAGDSIDVIVSSLEVGLDVAVSEALNVNTLFLYEDGFSGLEVDTATISLAVQDQLVLVIGQMTLPFGHYESSTLSDPLTLELGETADTAVQLATNMGAWSGSITLFNGDNEEIS
jgi:hypothetical protein